MKVQLRGRDRQISTTQGLLGLGEGLRWVRPREEGKAGSWGQGCRVCRPPYDFYLWDSGQTFQAVGLNRGGALSLRLEL